MGKSVPKGVKTKVEILLNESDEFSKDFEKNKEVINSMNLNFSKKIRNLIAGFVSRRKSVKE